MNDFIRIEILNLHRRAFRGEGLLCWHEGRDLLIGGGFSFGGDLLITGRDFFSCGGGDVSFWGGRGILGIFLRASLFSGVWNFRANKIIFALSRGSQGSGRWKICVFLLLIIILLSNILHEWSFPLLLFSIMGFVVRERVVVELVVESICCWGFSFPAFAFLANSGCAIKHAATSWPSLLHVLQ